MDATICEFNAYGLLSQAASFFIRTTTSINMWYINKQDKKNWLTDNYVFPYVKEILIAL